VAAALTHVPTHAPPSLPTIDHDRLAELEAVVDRGLHVFVDVGLALATIRDEQLYRATHPTFKAYLAQRWGFGQQWAYGRMYVARVALAIDAEHGPLPAGISVEAIRPLVPLLHRDGPTPSRKHGPPSRTATGTATARRHAPRFAPYWSNGA
jgi:hypothetical protein